MKFKVKVTVITFWYVTT